VVKKKVVPLPTVFTSPIRIDVVQQVFVNMNKNRRQAYAVKNWAGHQVAAESWGTGRAVSRIPRVPGSGTSRSGQGAFGNMCRKGRMFAPTKTWRRWHRKISKGQRRYATCSALAATSVPSLVLARGHRVEMVNEIPLVVNDGDLYKIAKTKEAVNFLSQIHADDDIHRVKDTRKLRRGKGKARNRRHVQRKGPLLVYQNEETKVVQAFRNIPGMEICHVTRLNLLQLAPGGHVGRFVIWAEDAFKSLDSIFGTFNKESTQKKGWTLPSTKMTNADLARIINSDEIQSAIRPTDRTPKFVPRRKNPLKNLGALVKLNPYALSQRRRQILASQKSGEKRRAKVQRSRVNPGYFENVLLGPQAIFVAKVKRPEIIDEGTNVPVTKATEAEEEVEPEKKEVVVKETTTKKPEPVVKEKNK
jgi:large subunit ribosomal protein L4e